VSRAASVRKAMVRQFTKPGSRIFIKLLVACLLPLFFELGPAARSRLTQTEANEQLSFGTAVDRELSGRGKHSYSFTVEAGQFVQAVVVQKGIDVVVAIFGPNGDRLSIVDRWNSTQGPETASMIAPASGAYRLVVWSDQLPGIRGKYRLSLKEPRAAISSDEKLIAAEKLVYEAVRLTLKNTAEPLRQAIVKYQDAQSLLSEVGVPFEEGIALYGKGWCHRLLGANNTALEVFKRALELMEQANDRLGVAIVRGGMGWAYFNLGALDKALECFRQSLQLREGLMDTFGAGRLYYGIGWSHLFRKENQLALVNFEESLRMREAANDLKGAAFTRIGLGKAYFRLEGYPEARFALEQALLTLTDDNDKGARADALCHLGWVAIRIKDYATAREHFQAALKLSLDPGDRSGEASARFGLAVLSRREGALKDALDQIKRAVDIFEFFRAEGAESSRTGGASDLLRIAYFAQVQELYEVYIDLLMRLDELEPDMHRAAEALHISEHARARNLLDLLARAGADAPEQKDLARPLRVDDIQRRLLDENTVLLEYALGSASAIEDDRSYLWLVTRESVEGHILPKRAEIESAAHRVYDLLTARNRISGPRRRELIAEADAEFRVEALRFSRMLLGPVATKITGKRLIIAPQGALQFVPFAALPSPETWGQSDREIGRQRDRENSPKNSSPALRLSVSASLRNSVPSSPRHSVPYTPLIVDHEVIVAPSASALAAIRRQMSLRQQAQRNVIVFADPVFSAADDRVRPATRKSSKAPGKTLPGVSSPADSPVNAIALPDLDRLSATDWEARKIAALARDSQVLRDFDANRAAAIDPSLGKYRYIHFASHAVFDPKNPDQSAIVLSQVDEKGRPINGFLSAEDIHHLRILADLVVLSACHTGLGKDVRGEGLLSLTRGFLASGAARVMVSLWSVEDQATAEMMSRFYRRLLGPQAMTPAAALRATQEEMWREGRWDAPYYWGGFVLRGEWR
jgi:CHAT domain-containing protein/tetratricopeptide (TPR) repeat protein